MLQLHHVRKYIQYLWYIEGAKSMVVRVVAKKIIIIMFIIIIIYEDGHRSVTKQGKVGSR